MALIIDQSATTLPAGGKRPPRAEAAFWAAAAFALTLLVCLPTIGRQSFWVDEVYTANAVNKSWSGLVADRLAAGHFPTYFLLMKGLGLTDASDAMLRLPSAIFESLAAALFAMVALRLGGRVTALVAVLLFAFMPLLVYYGQEARPYALMLLLIAIAMTGQLALFAGGAFGGVAPGITPKRAAVVATIGTLGATLTIPAAIVPVAASHAALVIAGGLRQGVPRRRLVLRHILVTWVATGLAALSLIPSVMATAQAPTGLMKWQAKDSAAKRLVSVAHELFGFGVVRDANIFLPAGWHIVPALGLMVAAILGAWLGRDRPAIRYLTAIVLVTIIGYLIVGSFTATVSRYLLGLIPPYLLLAAFAAGTLLEPGRSARPLVALAFAALIGLAGLQTLDATQSEQRYDWRPLAAFIADAGIGDQEILTNDPVAATVFAHYRAGPGLPTFRLIRDPESFWQDAKTGDPRFALAFYQGRGVPEDMAPGRAACIKSFGDATFYAFASSHELMPAPLRGCAGAPSP